MTTQVITTVVTAAVSYNLTTRQAAKDELDIKDGSKDSILDRYIAGASLAAAQYCNRALVVETLSDQFLPVRDASCVLFGGKIAALQLSRWPIVTLTSVIENGVLMVEGTDFVTDKPAGQLTRLDANGLPRRWPAFTIAIVYSAGYATIPADVEDAVIRMVTKRYSAKGRDATLKQENIPGVLERQFWIATGTEAGNMTPDITDILDNYRVPVTA